MNHSFRNALMILSLVLLSACTAIEKSPYPADWPAIDHAASDCTGMSGVYSSAAALQTYRHPHQDVLLALALLPPGEYLTQVQRVSLDFGSVDYLEVHALAEDGSVLLKRRYREGEEFLHCENGALILNPSKMPERVKAPDTPLVGFSRNQVELRKAQDGALVMRESGSATGMAFLLVPVHTQSEQWYLFRLWPDAN